MILLIVLVCCATSVIGNNSTKDVTDVEPTANTTKEILKASETSDPAKVEIVKQIRRLNEDGSYTVGYEADDGTFKIESRDVMGNVKGTFGYIDKDGEIKRVTYSTSSDSTPVPVTTTSTSSTPPTVLRVNKTVASTTRRPLSTVVYPTRSTSTTRTPVVQSIPRRRILTSTRPTTNVDEITTERQKPEATSSNILNLYKPKIEDNAVKVRTQLSNPMSVTVNDDLITKQTTVPPQTLKPVYEHIDEKRPEVDPNKANTIRRELTGTSLNPRMISLQQSAGDDSTDVYGSHLSLGTVPPLFTTTTPRPRLIPIQSIVAARQKIQQQFPRFSPQDHETTIEASTGRVFDQESVVTSNPVPVVHIAPHRPVENQIYQQQQIYRRPPAIVHFRTQEYLKDNPGAPIPIGNQRPFLQYEYQNKILEQQFLKEASSSIQAKGNSPEAATEPPYEIQPVTRFIQIPVDEQGIPLQGYQSRQLNSYRPTPSPQYQPRYEPIIDEMNSISAPVSTRDLKRLLQVLILRQNRLQSLMDQIVAPGPPYQPLPHFRREQPRYDYDRYQQPHQYQEDDRYDYRYDQQLRQQDVYNNQIQNYENPQPQYESQRYVPRRRLYTRPAYDTAGSSSNRIEESPEYLPAEIREALLLKMLMLAISPDFMPSPAPPTELTTAAPTRKQVRNVQILGEEGSTDNMKRHIQKH